MAAHFTHSSVPFLHRRLDREAAHRLALVVFTQGNGYGFGVMEGRTGECLAWDGMYLEREDMPTTTPLIELDWDEWDDMSSKLVLNAQRAWLAGPLGFWLMPSYSIAKEAADLVHRWADDAREDESHRADSIVRCYLPVTDEAAYEAHLAAAKEHSDQIRSRWTDRPNAD